MKIKNAAAALLLAASLPAGAATLTAASLDFDSAFYTSDGIFGSFGWFQTGSALGTYNGSNGKTWSGNIATRQDTDPVYLTLSNLPTHTAVSVDFLLGFLNSWDSTNGSPSPDFLNISIDGVLIKSLTTTTASGSITDYGGGTLLVDNGQIDSNQFYSDDLVDMATASFLTFAHTASTLQIMWQASGSGYQNFPDEFWGIDSIVVKLTTPGGELPEPGSFALAGLGLAGLATLRRRKQAMN
jgi:hypothetical protein